MDAKTYVRRAVWPLLFLGALVAALPAVGASRIDRELALEPGGQVVLDTAGSVSVVGRTRPGVRVVVTANEDIESKYDVEFVEEPGRVSVKIRKRAAFRWFGWIRGSGLRVEVDTSGGAIDVADVRGELRLATSGGAIRGANLAGDVSASTSGGAISLEGIGGDVRAESSGGGIRIEGVAGTVDADTSGGGIVIREAQGDVWAGSSGGGIEVLGAGGRVDADTSGGPVRVAFVLGNASGGSLASSGGGVTVSLDAEIGLEIDAASSGGGVVADDPIRVQGELSRSRLRGTLGSGGELLRLRSSGGGIRIEPASASGGAKRD